MYVKGKLYYKAFTLGLLDGNFNVVKLYEEWKGVEKNEYEALSFYQNAANNGSIKAIYRIGKIYECDKLKLTHFFP